MCIEECLVLSLVDCFEADLLDIVVFMEIGALHIQVCLCLMNYFHVIQ